MVYLAVVFGVLAATPLPYGHGSEDWSQAGSLARLAAPAYTEVVNGASFLPGAIAPNTFITIFGKNLAYVEKSLTADDIRAGQLPTVLAGTGVRVWINRIAAFIYYVSPTQINALVPTTLDPGRAEIQVQLDSTWGAPVSIDLERASPAMFQVNESTVIATHQDGSLITAESPARPNEWIALYATGLGQTSPQPAYGEIPKTAAPIERMNEFTVTLNGDSIAADRVTYAGVAPGFGGLYQINVHLPLALQRDPEIRISVGEAQSPPGLHLSTRPN